MDGSPLSSEFWSWVWETYKTNREHIVPLVILVGASILAWAALRQAKSATRQAQTATQQAEIAMRRHEAQMDADRQRTEADQQRRITENFTKAVEQLGSDKLQVRLGGIYALERISRESELDYWPIMETLTGFVRERAPWKDEEQVRWKSKDTPRSEPPTDVAAILTVIRRRDSKSRERERSENWKLNFRSTDLRGANLIKAHLEGAFFTEAHLQGAFFTEAHLQGANFIEAHLQGADLVGAHLQGAVLSRAHLEGAYLTEAHLQGAFLYKAHLEGAYLYKAHLEGANFNEAHLDRAILDGAHLQGAVLDGAHLEGADLTEAHLEGADLSNASVGRMVAPSQLPENFPKGWDAPPPGWELFDDNGTARLRPSSPTPSPSSAPP